MQTFLLVGFRQNGGLTEFYSAHEIEQNGQIFLENVGSSQLVRVPVLIARRQFDSKKNYINFKVELEQFAIHKFFKSANTAGEQKHDGFRETIR